MNGLVSLLCTLFYCSTHLRYCFFLSLKMLKPATESGNGGSHLTITTTTKRPTEKNLRLRCARTQASQYYGQEKNDGKKKYSIEPKVEINGFFVVVVVVCSSAILSSIYSENVIIIRRWRKKIVLIYFLCSYLSGVSVCRKYRFKKCVRVCERSRCRS